MAVRLLGIDSGGTMTKVAVFDADGNEIACAHRPNRIMFPKTGWTERDPDAMWQATCGAIAEVMNRSATDPSDIAAVTPSGFGAGLYFVDERGAPVRPALGSTDTRSSALIEVWRRFGTAQKLEAEIQQQIWAGQSLAILGWFQRHEPGVLDRTRHLLLCKDYLRLKLCGDISTDPTDAGCAGFANVAKGVYAEEAFGAAGLGHCIDKLPPIAPSTEIAGYVTAEAARATGLKAGTPVGRGVYDVVGCSLASGVARSDQLGIVAGTFSIDSTLHPAPNLDPLPTLQVAYPLGNLFLATIATATSASNLEWFCKTLLAAEGEKAHARGKSIYEVCSGLVAGALDRPNDILFFPYLYGGPMGAPAGLVGASAGSSLADVLRAVFEGIVFAHRTDIDYLLGGPGSAQVRSIRLSGGPSKSEVWSQLFCDALGLPLEVANGSEFGAKGAAMCGAVATGVHSDMETAVARMVRVSRAHTPEAGRRAHLDRAYARYRSVSSQLASVWSRPEPASEPAHSVAGAPA
jgi:L-xylulokinase